MKHNCTECDEARREVAKRCIDLALKCSKRFTADPSEALSWKRGFADGAEEAAAYISNEFLAPPEPQLGSDPQPISPAVQEFLALCEQLRELLGESVVLSKSCEAEMKKINAGLKRLEERVK